MYRRRELRVLHLLTICANLPGEGIAFVRSPSLCALHIQAGGPLHMSICTV